MRAPCNHNSAQKNPGVKSEGDFFFASSNISSIAHFAESNTFIALDRSSRPWIKSLSGGTAIDGDKAAFSVVQWAEAIHSPAAWSFQLV